VRLRRYEHNRGGREIALFFLSQKKSILSMKEEATFWCLEMAGCHLYMKFAGVGSKHSPFIVSRWLIQWHMVVKFRVFLHFKPLFLAWPITTHTPSATCPSTSHPRNQISIWDCRAAFHMLSLCSSFFTHEKSGVCIVIHSFELTTTALIHLVLIVSVRS